MKIFLDTANIAEIKRINQLGIVDGVTTNPSLVSKEGRNFEEVIKDICSVVPGPVSAEVIGLTHDEMVNEARQIAKWADNVVVKIPMTQEGLKAVHTLSQEGIKTNVTLIFSAAQALLAMKAGATFVSPFIGRLEDIGTDAYQLIADIRQIIDVYGFSTEIIAASVRNPYHFEMSAKLGAHIATVPSSLFEKLMAHPLTDQGIEGFLKDWEKFQNK
ncbi:fructose-6-phosphate aldolase [Ignavigranum ruoffiae]|uniref:fructose-6-phosphate aldolase n=1 Tax=Ignavigranum ruoffiae TaxID=89093 RepID=UPI00204A729B|nr:fructose-6-phosphate aldolase [Ignavigranum ruoffiae]UPQ86006.1 fructose-6-phosphate aldolase [Ignavigranum ruoffiae]